MSDDLKNFCRAVLNNIEREILFRDVWFNDDAGLCHNSCHYDREYRTRVNYELKTLFGDEDYPFNNGNHAEYDRDYRDETMYKNEKRLAFLREHAQL